MNDLDRLIGLAETLLERLDGVLPSALPAPDWSAQAWRWRKRQGRGFLHAISRPHSIRLGDLQGMETQKALLARNTLQFVRGLPANNVLLTGARGTGKSSLIKALLAEYADEGLRLLEVDKQDLADLPDIAELLGLRSREQLLAWIAEAGLLVLGRLDTRPKHPKAQDASDPLHAARSAEVTSLWRLGKT